MYLKEIFNPYLSSSTKHHRRHYQDAAGFDALPPQPPRVISLSWLSSAFDFLSFTHSEAAKILKHSPLNDTGIDGSLSFYLDDSLKVLHIHNCILSEIDRFSRRALVIRIALHLLTSHPVSSPEKLRRARDYLTKTEEVSSGGKWKRSVLIGGDFSGDVEDLLRDLASRLKTATQPPSRKASAVLPEVHAIGLVSVLISTAAVSALRGSAVAEEVISLVAPGGFAWADSFNELARRLGDLMRGGGEIREVEARVEEVVKAIDDMANDGGREKLSAVVEELGRLTEELREGLGKLADRVNGASKTIMLARACV